MKALDDSAITDRCTLYEDSANFLIDERFTKFGFDCQSVRCISYAHFILFWSTLKFLKALCSDHVPQIQSLSDQDT